MSGHIDNTQVLITDNDVAAMLGCSRATVWRHVGTGALPKPVRISGMTRWKRSEIIEIIDRAIEARDAEAA